MKDNVIIPLATRGNGDIYLGIVGAVRTGKSSFIKKVIENLIVPNIEDETQKKRCLDEIPQSAGGKNIMTTEPKFVPSNGANIKIEDFSCNVKLIDCVGYVIPNATGYEDENGNPRMIITPWFSEPISLEEAASIGTEKVIKDHSTIGIVVTTDGTIGDLKRSDYIEAEARCINELKNIGKPFIVILNSKTPSSNECLSIAKEIKENYDVPVMPLSVLDMREADIYEVLKTALYEYPVLDIEFSIPEWVSILDNKNDIKKHYLELIRNSTLEIKKLKDVDNLITYFENSKYINKAYISKLDSGTGTVVVNLDSSDELYNATLQEFIGSEVTTKASMLKVFASYKDNKNELDGIKSALKQAKSTGYGIVYPSLKDMKLDTPEVIKQGSRYGVKLRAVASSIHIMRTKRKRMSLIDYVDTNIIKLTKSLTM